MFIEPKGNYLLETDKWKEDFLLQLEQKSILTIQFKSDSKYKIWGLHFYSHGTRDKEFKEDLEKLSK